MTTTPTPLTPNDDDPNFNPGEVSTQQRLAPPGDGDFSHPAFENLPQNQYTLDEIAKGLFEDSGIEWPGQLPNRVGVDATLTNAPPVTDQQQQQQQQQPSEPTPTVKIGDVEVPVEEANTAIALFKLMKQGAIAPPQLPQSQTPQPPAEPPPPPPPPLVEVKLPDGITPDDPANKFFIEQLNKLNTGIAQLAQSHQEAIQQATISRVNMERDTAITKFKEAHPNFTDDEISQVAQTAAGLGIVGNLVENSPTPIDGILKALEIGMYQVQSTRDKVIASLGHTPPQRQSNADRQRQGKLSALSGSGGSTPRVESRPRLDNDNAMKQELAQAFEPYFANNSNSN